MADVLSASPLASQSLLAPRLPQALAIPKAPEAPPPPDAPQPTQYKENGFFSWLFGGDTSSKIIPDDSEKKFPGEKELANSQIYDQSYGDPAAPFFQMEPGAKGSQWNLNEAIENINSKGQWQKDLHNVTLTQDDKDRLETAWLGAQRSAIAALGFDPRKIITTPQASKDQKVTIGGAYSSKNDAIWRFDDGDQSTPVHESIHRGIEMLRKNGELPKSFSEFDKTSDKEETAVRALMLRHFGDVEMQVGAQEGNDQINKTKWWMNPTTYGSDKLQKALDDLESAASAYIAKMKPRGPR